LEPAALLAPVDRVEEERVDGDLEPAFEAEADLELGTFAGMKNW
jgi:hypothetical protein